MKDEGRTPARPGGCHGGRNCANLMSFPEDTVIQITESAARKLTNLKIEEGKTSDAFLRVEVKKGGCSGLSYKMDFDTVARDGDKTFESNGAKVVVDGQSFLYLIGMTLDYSGGLNGRGFVFSNPNATKNCGCGSSFNV